MTVTFSETAVAPENGTPPCPDTVNDSGEPPPSPFPIFVALRVSMIRVGLTATNELGELERLAEAELVKSKTDQNSAKNGK